MPQLPDAPSVVETSLIHNGQRRATSLLVDLLGSAGGRVPAAAVAELRDFLVASLDHHHRLEDDHLWPRLVAADPGLVGPLGRLSDDHRRLDAALSDLAIAEIADVAGTPDNPGGAGGTAALRAATTVRDLVHRHLDDEEVVLFPALRAHVSDDDWAAFSQVAVTTAPEVGRHLQLGFLDVVGTDDEVDLIVRHLPPPALEALPDTRRAGRDAVAELTAASRTPN
ncbi:MAG TPA: hemerythrin domain-containing protein [Acidimicrobiales bacterium]